MNNLIAATEIDAWAKLNPRRAQELLPELIVRLILCTSSKINDYNFPIEKGIQFSGYDGVLDSGEATSYFPEGKSVWEFGTNEDALGKFKSDIEKRHTEPLGVDINNTAFIFSTLKIWNHRTSIEEALNESRAKYNWKEIRIIDGAKIALWLQSYTAVAVWFANIIGKPIHGIRAIEDYWTDYCETTLPKLNKDYFLLGRDSQIDQLSKWIEKKSGSLTLISESSIESVLFVAAYFLNYPERDRAVMNKTLIVESPEEWNSLIISDEKDCLLIPVFNFTEDIRCPSELFIILPVAKYSPLSKITKNVDSIVIDKRRKAIYHKALETLGFESSDFLKIETDTKRSFLPLYRMITTIVARKKPKWLSESTIEDLIPAFLAGGWNGNVEGDREAVERLSGCKYEEYIQRISKWLTVEDAPIFKVFNTYQIVSIQDMWTFMYDYLTEEQVKKFRECVLAVFGAEDPTFELPEERWAMAAIYGKEAKYSDLLCQGLTISLILFSEQSDRENYCNIMSTGHYVYSLVSEILKSINTWQQWNTIAPLMTLLAEASPTAVLEKLEQEVINNQSEMWVLFKPTKDVFWGRSYYTHILWTLEQLVWYECFVVRAIDLLAQINEKGFKYTLQNSPLNTLYEIFCTWYPQCCLDCNNRIELLRKICRKYPTTGNELITKLLPTGHSTCGCIQKPRWHSFENEFDEGVTRKEHSDTLQAIADIAMSGAATAVQWSNIIKHASFFFRARVSWVDTLMEYCKEIPELERNEIAKSLRSEINRNREFCNADWAIPKEFVDKMEQVLLNLLPAGCEQYEYLFKQNPKLLHPIPYEEGTFDYQKRRSYLRGIRMNVIHQILDKCGADTLIEFSFKAEDTEELAEIIVETILHRTYDFPLICKIKLENHRLYVSVLWRLYQANGLEQFLIALGDAELTNEQIADMLCYGPLEPSVWEKLEEFGEDVARYYWEHISVFRLDEEYNEHWDYFLGQLLKYNRPFSAAHAIVFSGYSNSTMIMNILRKCCELQDYTESTGATFMGLAEHDILNLFEKLHSDQNIELDKLVQLEVSFLPYFRFNSTPKGIIRHLHNNPIEYVNLLTYNYKPDPGSDFTMKEHSDDWGRLAYEIVELFKVVPGCRETPVSEREFKEWVAVAQDYADSIGYSGSFAYCFGRVLSYAPTGDDGIFPHEMVRDYFEHTHCEKLIEGFIAGKQSQRGVHTVTGGMEEKEISIKYREDASKLHISYPHTAAILEKLAECYWQESLYEQKRELLDFRG